MSNGLTDSAHGTPAGERCTHPRVYFDMAADNFYCADCRRGMGVVFWHQWRRRYREFGINAESAGPPPRSDTGGSGEAHSWDGFIGCDEYHAHTIKCIGAKAQCRKCLMTLEEHEAATSPAPEPASARELDGQVVEERRLKADLQAAYVTLAARERKLEEALREAIAQLERHWHGHKDEPPDESRCVQCHVIKAARAALEPERGEGK